ncbi:hypothetical protein PMIN02_012518 [Paraphaeosphaeria minitans]
MALSLLPHKMFVCFAATESFQQEKICLITNLRDANTSIRVIFPSRMRIEYPTLAKYEPAQSTLFARAYLILHLLSLLAAILRAILHLCWHTRNLPDTGTGETCSQHRRCRADFLLLQRPGRKRNTAVAVLRRLVHHIMAKCPELVKHALPYFETPERTQQTLSSLETM